MDVFRETWENQVRILTEAVDDITTIDDFLAVSGAYIHIKLCWWDVNIEIVLIILINQRIISWRMSTNASWHFKKVTQTL